MINIIFQEKNLTTPSLCFVSFFHIFSSLRPFLFYGICLVIILDVNNNEE